MTLPFPFNIIIPIVRLPDFYFSEHKYNIMTGLETKKKKGYFSISLGGYFSISIWSFDIGFKEITD